MYYIQLEENRRRRLQVVDASPPVAWAAATAAGMPRTHRSIEDIHAEFSDDFTIVNGNLLLCKFCDTIVKWRKKTRVIEHMSTKMHAERKESKLKRLVQESIGMMDEAEDYEDDKVQ